MTVGIATFDDSLSLVGRLDYAGISNVHQAGRDVVKADDSHLEARSEGDWGIHYY